MESYKNTMITEQELDYIRFYMGDPEIVNRGDMKGGPKAYNTINALLHSGIQNETDKIREGRTLEIEDAAHLKSYIALCLSIYSAMEKYRKEKQNRHLITYRVDRESSMNEIKGKTAIEGFYSTCKWGFLESYAHIKENVAMIEVRRDETVPYLDFEELFEGYYAKPEEAELLIPFGAAIQKLEEVELSKEEKETYTDINGNPPLAKYILYLSRREKESVAENLEDIYAEITSEETVERVQKCLKELMEEKELKTADFTFYVGWKEKLQFYLYHRISVEII